VIPLDEQLRIFEERERDAYYAILYIMYTEWPRVVALARERLIAGYCEFGDQMFRWDSETRHRNVLEELADALNYSVSAAPD
jgi:hypothetical protein